MKQTNSGVKKYPTIGVCGLDCGLCPRYYTNGPSKCPGCGGPNFFNKHPSCSFITCFVKKKHLEVCGGCMEFPCAKFKNEEEYQQIKGSASYPPYRNVMANLINIKEQGIQRFIAKQNRRIKLLETMIADFDDGRSKSFYCRTVASLSIKNLENAMDIAIREINAAKIEQDDIKTKAKILKTSLNNISKPA